VAAKLVSVILPYFNRGDILGASIDSVLAQTHQEFVLLLVDDGSTDSSPSIARSFADDRIVHLRIDTNRGAAEARNVGLREAKTVLVAFMDSDDRWHPSKLERQLAYLTSMQANGAPISLVGCGWRYAGVNGGGGFPSGPFGFDEVLAGHVRGIGTPLLLVDRSETVEGVDFDPSFRSLEERDFVLRCLANGTKLLVVPEVLAVVTRGRHDHVANPKNSAQGYERLLQKYAADLASQPELKSWYSYGACREHLRAGNRRGAMGFAREALAYEGIHRGANVVAGVLGGSKGLSVASRIIPHQSRRLSANQPGVERPDA
jgi:glycosyltransferase involved in cell wall biosynthesis